MQDGRTRKTGTIVIGRDPLGTTLAGAVAEYVEEPLALVPVLVRGNLVAIEVDMPGGSVLADRAVLSSGRHPRIPDAFAPHLGRRVFHDSELTSRLRDIGPELPVRWLVLGSGPGVADAARGILDRRPDALVATASGVERVSVAGDFYDVVFRDDTDGRPRFLPVDAVVLATGYEQPRIPPMLAAFLPWLQFVGDSAMAVDGDDRVHLSQTTEVEIFVIGYAANPPGTYDTPFFPGAATRMERVLLSPPKRARAPGH